VLSIEGMPEKRLQLSRVTSQWLTSAVCWQILDSNGSGELTSQEFCAAMKKLVLGLLRVFPTCPWPSPNNANHLPQPFQPKLHMTDADFQSITRNGELCDEEGGLGTHEFELVMREQVRLLIWSARAVQSIPDIL
jgi:hypothetical protein